MVFPFLTKLPVRSLTGSLHSSSVQSVHDRLWPSGNCSSKPCVGGESPSLRQRGSWSAHSRSNDQSDLFGFGQLDERLFDGIAHCRDHCWSDESNVMEKTIAADLEQCKWTLRTWPRKFHRWSVDDFPHCRIRWLRMDETDPNSTVRMERRGRNTSPRRTERSEHSSFSARSWTSTSTLSIRFSSAKCHVGDRHEQYRTVHRRRPSSLERTSSKHEVSSGDQRESDSVPRRSLLRQLEFNAHSPSLAARKEDTSSLQPWNNQRRNPVGRSLSSKQLNSDWRKDLRWKGYQKKRESFGWQWAERELTSNRCSDSQRCWAINILFRLDKGTNGEKELVGIESKRSNSGEKAKSATRKDRVDYFPFSLRSNTAKGQSQMFFVWFLVLFSSTVDFHPSQHPNSTTEVENPYGIFVTGDDTVYVGSTTDCRIHVFSPIDSAEGKVCAGLVVSVDQHLYCSVQDGHKVIRMPIDGSALGTHSGKLNEPRGIFVDMNLTFYVADWRNHRVQRFLKGEVNGTTNVSVHLFKPTAVVLDGDGFLFILDSGNSRILIERSNSWQCLRTQKKLNIPRSFVFDSSGNIFVTVEAGKRIDRFQWFPIPAINLFLFFLSDWKWTFLFFIQTRKRHKDWQRPRCLSPLVISPLLSSSPWTSSMTSPISPPESFFPGTCPAALCELLRPCQHSGTCADDPATKNGFRCSCPEGVGGDFCEEDHRACQLESCWNEGSSLCLSRQNKNNIKTQPIFASSRLRPSLAFLVDVLCVHSTKSSISHCFQSHLRLSYRVESWTDLSASEFRQMCHSLSLLLNTFDSEQIRGFKTSCRWSISFDTARRGAASSHRWLTHFGNLISVMRFSAARIGRKVF